MDNKIPTAEEYFNSIDVGNFSHYDLIEFAKIHVTAALKQASEKAFLKFATTDFYDDSKIVSKNSILKAYPLTNIK